MLFLLVFCVSCHHVFDFTNRNTKVTQIIYMNPLDLVDIIVGTDFGVFFSDWSKCEDLYLNIETLKQNETYGPFNSKSRLMMCAITNEPYKLRFVNEGTNRIKFGLIISKYYDALDRFYFPSDFRFPVYEHPLDKLKILRHDDEYFYYDYYVGFSILILFYIGILLVLELIFMFLHICFIK